MDQAMAKLKEVFDFLNKEYVLTGKYKTNKFIFLTILAVWGFYALLKNNGLLPKKNMKGEHVFITGAGAGLGMLMATEFAKLGCKLSLSDIREDLLEESKKYIMKHAKVSEDKICTFICDVSNLEHVKNGA
jgi:hypothetical protein